MSNKRKYVLAYILNDLLEGRINSVPIRDNYEAANRIEAAKKAAKKLNKVETLVKPGEKSYDKVWYAQIRREDGLRVYNILYEGRFLINPRTGRKIKKLTARERDYLNKTLRPYSEKKQQTL